MTVLWAPNWVGELLGAGALVDDRDIALNRRRTEVAMRAAPPPPDPEVAHQMDQMAKIDEALARPMPPRAPIEAAPPPPPELTDTPMAGPGPAPMIEQPAPPPAPMPPPALVHGPMAGPGPVATIAPVDPPRPFLGPDGQLHLPAEGSN